MDSKKISFAAVAVSVAGLFGALATFLTWWTYQAGLKGGSSVDVSIKGVSNWTGQVAAVAGFAALVFGAASILMNDSSLERIFLIGMAVASVILTGAALIGALSMDSIVQSSGGPVDVVSASRGVGLLVTLLAGVVAFAGSLSLGAAAQAADASAEEPVQEAAEAG